MVLDKTTYYLNLATSVAMRSKDPRTQVGAVLVGSEGEVLSTGYNGFVRGAQDSRLPKDAPEKYDYFIHAEMNAILNAARQGIKLLGATSYQTHSPCKHCARFLLQCGITKIYFINEHHSFKETRNQKDYLLAKYNDGYIIETRGYL